MTREEIVKEFPAVEYKNGERKDSSSLVIREMPLTIYLNEEELVTLLCTPERVDYLALGFLWSEGLLNSKEDVQKIVVDLEKGRVWVEADQVLSKDLFFKRLISSGCGKGITFYNAIDSVGIKKIITNRKISTSSIFNLMVKFESMSKLYQATHGVHSAALSTPKEIVMFREDIGRHNAVDKILGECLITNLSLEDKILITSGRVSSEVLLKVAKRGIPFLISRTSPTDLGIRLAERLGVTLVGFARGRRMKVYTHIERVVG